jgi:leucyl/phenylalanyl-tRNA--protein transferase
MEIDPELLLNAYAAGVFPMADSRDGEILWYEALKRGVIEFDKLRISRSLAKVIRSRRFFVTYNRAFDDVISACAEREETWISYDIETSYRRLHDLGFAHSIEVWEGDRLVGGLYGVALGGAFFGESMFHRVTDASKVALVYLVGHLEQRGFLLLDTQFITPHLVSLGAVEIEREEYHQRLTRALALDSRFHSAGEPAGLLEHPDLRGIPGGA